MNILTGTMGFIIAICVLCVIWWTMGTIIVWVFRINDSDSTEIERYWLKVLYGGILTLSIPIVVFLYNYIYNLGGFILDSI